MATAYQITDKSNDTVGIVSDVDEDTIQIEWESGSIDTLSNDELKSLLETDEYEIDEVTINEDTPAQASIQMKSGATPPGVEADGNPKTRLEMMLAVIGALGQMDFDTLAQYHSTIEGSEPISVNQAAQHAGLDGNVNGNQASIQMKPSAAMAEALVTLEKEEQDSIFGASTLTEEAKTKMTTLFETAVSARVLAETVKIQEELEKKYDRNIQEMSEGLVDKMDEFMNYVVNEWVEENKVAIESSLRTQLTNEFLDQLKAVFVENYIDIPEDKVDVLEAVVFENEGLKKQINDKLNESIAKDKEVKALRKTIEVEKLAEGLTLVQKEKLRTLVAETEFVDVESFTKKVNVIKEGFLKVGSKESTILTEGIVTEEVDNVVSSDPAITNVARYL